MTKNELAKTINLKADTICRVITSNYELDFEEGLIYDNKGKAESWNYDGAQSFIPESNGSITYVLYCDNVDCHKVDYNDPEECEILGCGNCESEGEVLVPLETKMRIVQGPQEVDMEEMGYYIIYLEVVKEY